MRNEEIEELVLLAAAWTGTCSKEWRRLREIAERVPGLQEKLDLIKEQRDSRW